MDNLSDMKYLITKMLYFLKNSQISISIPTSIEIISKDEGILFELC